MGNDGGDLHPVFERRAAASGFVLDADQRRVAARLTALGRAVAAEAVVGEGVAVQAAAAEDAAAQEVAARGVYLWGAVGRGKTWLLDTFVSTLPTGAARRLHLHALFRGLHAGIQRHGYGEAALRAALREIVGGAAVLHLEEFHVHDPGNAALLARLLDALADARITLVTSSNYAPNDLCTDPELRHVFLPATAMITRRLAVLALDGGVDYRLGAAPCQRGEAAAHGAPAGRAGTAGPAGAAERAGTAGSAGAGAAAVTAAPGAFRQGRWIVAAPGAGAAVTPSSASPGTLPERPHPGERVDLSVDGRGIRALRAKGREVCFSFEDLLEASTAASDFLALCERFDSWLLVDVPDLRAATSGARQRFVTLVDVLCDLDVRLTVVAATDRSALAAVTEPPPDVARTISRLALLAD